MFDNDLYAKTFSKLRASENTLTEVLKMTTHRNEQYSSRKVLSESRVNKPHSAIKRFSVIAATVILAIALATTAIAKGGDIITYLGNNVWGMAVSGPDAIDGYSLASETGEYLAVDWIVDGEVVGMHRGYVFSLDISGGKHTLSDIAFYNGEMVMIKPLDASGFNLTKGESITVYAELNTSPKYADDNGELTEIGCYVDGELYETYIGKLTQGTFTITAPCDGEFMVYLKNYCAGVQNYTEISVY